MITRNKVRTMTSLFKMNYKTVTLLMILTALQSCNQTKNDNAEKPHQYEQTENVINEIVSLSVQPNILKLSEFPNLVEVTMTNNTKDTITTGLYYRIEYYDKNQWNEVSPEQVFEDLGWKIIPSGSHTFETKFLPDKINYKTSKYRIVKYYLKSDYQKTKEKFYVYAEFDIE